MKIIELGLNYDEIRERIELDKDNYKVGEWAELTGTSRNVISNIHGRAGKHKPSLQYIIAVSRFTGKPIEWYLYGKQEVQIENRRVAEVPISFTDRRRKPIDAEHLDFYEMMDLVLETKDENVIFAARAGLRGLIREILDRDPNNARAADLLKLPIRSTKRANSRE